MTNAADSTPSSLFYPPEDAKERRLRQLERAQANRMQRARLMPGRGRRRTDASVAAAYLRELPECLESMLVGAFLDRVHRIGPAKVRRGLRAAGVGEMRRLDQLTERQRHELADWLGR